MISTTVLTYRVHFVTVTGSWVAAQPIVVDELRSLYVCIISPPTFQLNRILFILQAKPYRQRGNPLKRKKGDQMSFLKNRPRCNPTPFVKINS
jgi:hypothetical protein